MVRHWILLVVVSALGTAFDQRATTRAHRDGSDSDERNVILVVSDGLRWQEVFRGADSTILFGDSRALGDQAEATRRKYWRSTVAQRREALMPFLWSTLARDGQLLGNRDLDSRVAVTNEMKFSYPGYNEMLTGRPDPRIDNNEFGPNPNVTVFERLNRWGAFRGRVAAFGTWDTFRDIFNVNRSGIDVQTFGAKPNDVIVQRAVLSYLGEKRPRALFVGYAETDDWGHEGRYDRFLDAAHDVDRFIAELWAAVQSHPQYRGKTSLIFTADHGRGRTPADWTSHGQDVPGAEETFILLIGPETTARGERRNTAHVEGQVAGATASAVGFRAPAATAGR
jgi:type I phosphodiesterase/nucleotide pyrophosphatase